MVLLEYLVVSGCIPSYLAISRHIPPYPVLSRHIPPTVTHPRVANATDNLNVYLTRFHPTTFRHASVHAARPRTYPHMCMRPSQAQVALSTLLLGMHNIAEISLYLAISHHIPRHQSEKDHTEET